VASRVRCLDAGADDYLTKPFAVAELRARVRALSRRTRSIPLARIPSQGVELDFARRRALASGKQVPVTGREWEILSMLHAEGGRVVPRSALLERIWRDAGDSAAASLEVLVGRIRKKLGEGIVRTVRGEGYAFGGE
jgi:DNA-binding response OmpR family regulator